VKHVEENKAGAGKSNIDSNHKVLRPKIRPQHDSFIKMRCRTASSTK
jgi:hypothetical protein